MIGIIFELHDFEHGERVVEFGRKRMLGEKSADAFERQVTGKILTDERVHHRPGNARRLNVILVVQCFERMRDGKLVGALRHPFDDAGFPRAARTFQYDAARVAFVAGFQDLAVDEIALGVAVDERNGAQSPEPEPDAGELIELVAERFAPPRGRRRNDGQTVARRGTGNARTVDFRQSLKLVLLFVARLRGAGLFGYDFGDVFAVHADGIAHVAEKIVGDVFGRTDGSLRNGQRQLIGIVERVEDRRCRNVVADDVVVAGIEMIGGGGDCVLDAALNFGGFELGF